MSKIVISATNIVCDVCETTSSPLLDDISKWLWLDGLDVCPKCSVQVLSHLIAYKHVPIETIKEIVDDISTIKK